MSLRHVSDLLTVDVADFFHILNVYHHMESSEQNTKKALVSKPQPLSLRQALSEIGVRPTWSEGDDAIISTPDLMRIADELVPWNIVGFDTSNPDPESTEKPSFVDRLPSTEEPAVLSEHLSKSRVLLVSHDSTWLDVESTVPRTTERIAGRFLWMVLATALHRSGLHTDIDEPPSRFLQALFNSSETFCTRLKWIEVDTDRAVIPYSSTQFGGLTGRKWVKKPPRRNIMYTINSGSWSIRSDA